MKSDISKSIATALGSKGNEWLANQLKITVGRVQQMRNQRVFRMDTVERLATVFDMPVSEFIKLGET